MVKYNEEVQRQNRESQRLWEKQLKEAEKAFLEGNYIKVYQFGALCDKYNFKLPSRLIGWINQNLCSQISINDYKSQFKSSVIMKYVKEFKNIMIQ